MIRIEAVQRSWGDFALRNVNLEVTDDQYMVILGPCGSGKTLLLETIAGLYTPERGRILIGGVDVASLPPEQRRTGLVYQQYALFPHLSVKANIDYGLRYLKLSRREREQRAVEAIELLGIEALADRASPSSLSGGEAQKVALARALAIRPQVLLLDEPLSSLDQQARDRIIDLLPQIRRQLGIPVIHVTHHYSEAMALADHVGIMNSGSIVQTGTVDEVFRHPRNTFVADFLGVAYVPCQIHSEQNGTTTGARLGDLTLAVANPHELAGNAALCIRPEDAIVHAREPQARNAFPVHVTELHDLGVTVRLGLRFKTWSFTALMPESLFAQSSLQIGDAAWLELPEEKLHLMTLEPGL